MKHISLFSGIGGAELAAEQAGWHNVLSCDINEFGNKILQYYWPDAYHHTDIHTLNYDTINTELTRRFGDWRNEPIIITGGFPCQPYSAAGKRQGTEDPRHLWPEMLRIIREVSPDWIVGENVFGLTNWSGGLVFEQVQIDLEACGYEVQPFILPACGVNAPHKRDRVWFVAHTKSNGNIRIGRVHDNKQSGNTKEVGCGLWDKSNNNGKIQPTADPMRNGQSRQKHGQTESGRFTKTGIPTDWSDFPTQPPICGRNDGVSKRLDGVTFPKWRNESIKGYGNAWVPQVALQIFRAINEYIDSVPGGEEAF
jgi:DNA (cytosine-5)-methyltransferase 1